jgi:tetratricopeptide (TPR) repeat protein
VATASVLVCGTAGAQPSPVEALRREAFRAASEQRWDEAIAILRKAAETDPRNAAVRLDLGESLKFTGRLSEAISQLTQALEIEPANEPAALALGDAYRRVPNYDEARATLEKAVVSHPRSARALIALGELEIELQRYDAAVATLDKAAALAPADVMARVDLGAAHRGRNDLDSAIRELNEAIRLDPDAPGAYYFRGSSYADQNRNEEALADARKVIALRPDSVPGRMLAASTLVRMGRCVEAVGILEAVTAEHPNQTDPAFLLTRAYQCAGQAELAKQATARFADLNKREQSGRENRTQSLNLVIKSGELARANQMEPAIAAAQEAIQKDPSNSNAYAQLAKIYFSAGLMDEAHQAIEQAIAGNHHHPDFLYVLGRVLSAKGDFAGAIRAYEENLLVNPRDAEASFQKGLAHAALGQRDLAVAAVKAAIALDPADENYRRGLETLTAKP